MLPSRFRPGNGLSRISGALRRTIKMSRIHAPRHARRVRQVGGIPRSRYGAAGWLDKAGAARRNINVTEYIAGSTCTQAEIDLADQNHFVLLPKAWNAFAKALDAPPKPAGLKRLFSRASVAESR